MTIRVAFDMTPTIGTRTGIGHVVSHVYEELHKNSAIELAPYALSYKARAYRSELPETTKFITVPARIMLMTWKYSNFPRFDRQLGSVDLIHATNYLAPPTNSPLLITIHDLTMLKYPELVTAHVRSLAPIIRKRLASGAHVHVPSHAIEADVFEFFGDVIDTNRIHVVPFGTPSMKKAEPGARIKKLVDGDPYLLCIGSLEPRKNHARLIEAFGYVYKKNPHMRLFIVGPDGPARPEIDIALSHLPHEARARVTITGSVNQGDRTYLLRNALAIAYPSLYEGFGLPLLEAMTAETPVVCSREGSLAEVGGNAAHYVDAHDVDSITQGLLDVIDSATLRDQLVTAGTKQLSHFSWDKTATLLTDVYGKVIAMNSSTTPDTHA